MTPARKCMVVSTAYEAKKAQLSLGDEWHVIPAGSALMGYHYSLIVMVDGWDRLMEPAAAAKWFQDTLSHRRVTKEVPVIGMGVS